MEDSEFRKKVKEELFQFITHQQPLEQLFLVLKNQILSELNTRKLSEHSIQQYTALLDDYAQKHAFTTPIQEADRQSIALKMTTALFSIYLAVKLFDDTEILNKLIFIGLIDSLYSEKHFSDHAVLALNRHYHFFSHDEIATVFESLNRVHSIELPHIIKHGIQTGNIDFNTQENMLELIHFIFKDRTNTEVDLVEIKPDEKSDKLSEIISYLASSREVLLMIIIERFALLTFLKHFDKIPIFHDYKNEISVESLLIHACIADKIGFRWAKGRIEDEVLKLTNPAEFTKIRKQLKETISQREKFIQKLIKDIEKTIKKSNLKAAKNLLKFLKLQCEEIQKLDFHSPDIELVNRYLTFLTTDFQLIIKELPTGKGSNSNWFTQSNQLTDAEFSQLNSLRYQPDNSENHRKLQNILNQTRNLLRDANLVSVRNVFGRPKNIYSMYRKEKERDVPISQHHDLVGVRIIVNKSDLFQKILLKCNKFDLQHNNSNNNYAYYCYNALSLIQPKFYRIEKFKDFIKSPKCNGYQSLHIVYETKKANFPFIEIQIRDEEMEKSAEYGNTAHWIYDRAGKKSIITNFDASNWNTLREKYSNKRENEITIMTTTYEIKKISNRSTVLDFAYSLSPEIGSHCSKVYVNNQLVSFDTILRDGDRVKIYKSETQKLTPKWLKYVKIKETREIIQNQIKNEITNNK